MVKLIPPCLTRLHSYKKTACFDNFFKNPSRCLKSMPDSSNNHSNGAQNLKALGTLLNFAGGTKTRKPSLLDTNMISSTGELVELPGAILGKDGVFKETSWQIHVYAHRHNVHITVARPPAWRHPVTGKVYGDNPPSRSVALSLSAGRLGFKHSGRKHYDSAFQLATYVMARMQESGINSYIEKLEVYLRGFGAGREAVTRVLLGMEGRHIRKKIVKVADSTRLKFGGTRSANPRRLG
ncbi:unnamed protein product [Blumeria hordei]|uniref:Ribosomal protein S11 n=2 Tax=Blumeria hordei TaxID=2867405 RepID=A0A383UWC9_BLUHO|nr:putative 37S mitochondrial ribosomal protein S11 [Blumeria hordei DH14]SZF04674.1 unnamed protein product [Blumeria hordei]